MPPLPRSTAAAPRRLAARFSRIAPALAAAALMGSPAPQALAASGAAGATTLAELSYPEIAMDSAATLSQTLLSLDALSRQYMEHVIVLASGFFEGRKPGTNGDTLTAQYGSWHFNRLKLVPAFSGETTAANGSTVLTPNASWLQPFEVGGTTKLTKAEASWSVSRATNTLALDQTFTPLGFSGNGRASGPLVFVGYGIEQGPSGYSSFHANTDLTGKIAVVMRYEPMDENGRSQWGNRGRWSSYASMAEKVQAVAKRGAAGIVLVNPPGTTPPRGQALESLASTNYGFTLDIPAVMIDAESAALLIETGSGKSLMELRQLADKGELTTLDLNAQPVRFSMAAELERVPTRTANVGAILPGKGALANEYIIVGGHMDHLGYGESSSRYRGPQRLIHHGADDNASGAAGVLIAAEVLAAHYAALPDDADARSVLFLLFGAEEMGLLGAKHFVEHPSIRLSDAKAMLNMDMIGRLAQNNLVISGTATAEEWDSVLDPLIERLGFNTTKTPSGVGASDHTWFFRSDIPVLHFFSGLHPDYHHPNDTWDKLHHVEATRLAVGVAELAATLATQPKPLTFQASETPRPSANREEPASDAQTNERPQLAQMRVRMGVMPSSYEEGSVGLEVAGVTPGGSADVAGLKAGDVILLWNGEELAGVAGLMSRLSKAEPGEVVDLVVRRDGKQINLQMTLQAREPSDG